MILIYLLFAGLVSFFSVLFLTAPAKKFLERSGITGIDQQKKGKPKMATSGGVIVMVGMITGIFFFIWLNTFIFRYQINLVDLLAACCSIFLITFVGFVDDINVARYLVKNKGIKDVRIGLKQWQKPLLTLPAAIPLVAVMVGDTTVNIPFFGLVDFGIFYTLLIIPLAVVFVSNATNMLAGMNGLEAGLGFVSMLSLGIYSYFHGRIEASLIAFTLCLALLAFLKWNWFPAKILPGDSLTYLIGASYVSVVIIGNIEKFGIILFIPWIIEFFLKLRSKFKARSLGDLKENETLEAPYKKIYSLTHVVMKLKKAKEREITLALIIFEILVAICAFLFA